MQSLTKCLEHVCSATISPLLRNYLGTVIQQTETFKDPCTQDTIHTETQCVPLKLLTVLELEESRGQGWGVFQAGCFCLVCLYPNTPHPTPYT